jgi:hypothetical protein
MQPIEFRGKAKETGEWVFGYYYANKPFTELRHYIKLFEKVENVVAFEVELKTVTQFTNKSDKHNDKVYAGDIIDAGAGWLNVVKWNEETGGFGMWNERKKQWDDSTLGMVQYLEKKGNMFDNPELLK